MPRGYSPSFLPLCCTWNDGLSAALADTAALFGEEASTLASMKLARWVSLLLATLLISSVWCDQCCGTRRWVSLLIPHIIRGRLSQADFTDDNYSSQRSDLSASVRYTGTDPYDD